MALLEQVRLAVADGVTDPAAIAELIGERPARVTSALTELSRSTPAPEPEEGEE